MNERRASGLKIPLLFLALLLLLAPVARAEPMLEASLHDAERLAEKAAAKIEARVSGLELVDPASVREQARPGQGHLHYRVDDGPVIATTATQLSFHELAPGAHRFEVTLVGNDHQPLGPSETLHATVPARPRAERTPRSP
jgi:hypothetical protein